MHVRVKICGISTIDVARVAIDAGADALGLVFAQSPRRVDLATAKRLLSFVPPFVTTVAVFRYPTCEEIITVVSECAPTLVQAEPTTALGTNVLSGARLLPVFHEGQDCVADVFAYANKHPDNPGILLEAAGRGGRGIAPDWNVAAEIARRTPLVLAGGLNAENLGDAITHVRPKAVDVSSGVESSPGKKDPARIREFVFAVREAEKLLNVEVDL